MSNGTVSHRKFSVPGGSHRHRGIFKWILIILVVLAGIAALNREWINFQIHVLMVKIGSSDTRTKSLHWFMENAPREARPVFFEVMLEDADLRQLAVNGLLESDQKELLPVYFSLWRDRAAGADIRDTVLELIADHAGSRGFFLFTDPSMVLSAESRYWALAYDYLNANASTEMVDFLINRYNAGDAEARKAAMTALSYLRQNSVLAKHPRLRSLVMDALESPDAQIRFRAVQAFGPAASANDIPALLLMLLEDDKSVTDATGSTLRYLGRKTASPEADKHDGLRELAVVAADIQEKGYPQEVVYQLRFESLARLWGLALFGSVDRADELASRLAGRARHIMDDITCTRFVSLWNHYELSTVSTSLPDRALRHKCFGAVVSPGAGKIDYGQILAMGAGRVIYRADVDAWEHDYQGERERFMQHRGLAEQAGLEQVIRVEVSDAALGNVNTFSSAFGHIFSATRYSEGATTKYFEISLKPDIDPVKAYEEYATLFREAVISAKRNDSSVKMFVGPLPLGDRRWYGSQGAIRRLMVHTFGDGEQFKNFVDGISISSSLPLDSLERELVEFEKSFRQPTSGILLWCTGLGQPSQELRSTTAHLERDFVQSAKAASELPASISLLALRGVSAIFLDPLKDTPVPGDPRTVKLSGMLYRDCMPKPIYHAASRTVDALKDSSLAGALQHVTGPGTNAVIFPGGPRPVVIAWPQGARSLAQIDIKSRFARVTRMLPDALGNFRFAVLEAKEGEITVPLDESPIIVEQLESGPSAGTTVAQQCDLDIMMKFARLSKPVAPRQRSYGTHDRSGGNDDGFSGTSSYLYRRDNGEYVIFDAAGPGCLTRLWLGRAGNISRIRFYFNGDDKPGIDVTPEEMFGDRKMPFKYPLSASGNSAGGGSLAFLPIWFSKRLVIATAGTPKFCQVDYSSLNSSTEFENSTMKRLTAQSDRLGAIAARLTGETTGIHADCPPSRFQKDISLPPGEKVEVFEIKGPGVIQCLRVECANPDDMEHVILQIHWDGSDTAGVGSPLADILGQKYGARHWRGLCVGYMGGEGYLHYPMPFAKSARVVLTNTGSAAAGVSLNISKTTLPPGEEVKRYFCCHWKTAIAGPDKGVRLLSIKGAGHFAGCVLSLYSREEISYLDSDILIFADNESSPVVHSTGIDDYFGGANFYESGPFNLPYCGLLAMKDAKTVQYRFNVTDPIGFEKSFSFTIEKLPAAVRQTVMSGAFFWYSESPSGGD